MRLLRLRSTWGLRIAGDRHRFFAGLRADGWDGIEGSLLDIGGSREERQESCAAAAEAGMHLVLSAYSSWHSYEGQFDAARSVEAHAEALASELREIAELHSRGPTSGSLFSPILKVNAHSGSDAWTQSEAQHYFESVGAEAASLGSALPSVSHETHRGRYLCCPFATARLLEVVPSLRLTSDFSHWVVKCERLFDSPTERALLEDVLAPAVDHVHARIGTAQAPQAGDPADPCVAGAAERHYEWWRSVWSAREAAAFSGRDAVLTATLEYGPPELDGTEYVGYTPVDKAGGPSSGLAHEDLLLRCRDALDSSFETWHGDSQRMGGW